jgi:hypothetical protein
VTIDRATAIQQTRFTVNAFLPRAPPFAHGFNVARARAPMKRLPDYFLHGRNCRCLQSAPQLTFDSFAFYAHFSFPCWFLFSPFALQNQVHNEHSDRHKKREVEKNH